MLLYLLGPERTLSKINVLSMVSQLLLNFLSTSISTQYLSNLLSIKNQLSIKESDKHWENIVHFTIWTCSVWVLRRCWSIIYTLQTLREHWLPWVKINWFKVQVGQSLTEHWSTFSLDKFVKGYSKRRAQDWEFSTSCFDACQLCKQNKKWKLWTWSWFIPGVRRLTN